MTFKVYRLNLLVSIKFIFKGAFLGDLNVLRLFCSKLSDRTTKTFHHEPGDFFVKFLGQSLDVHRFSFSFGFSSPRLLVQVHLREHLICKRSVHHS